MKKYLLMSLLFISGPAFSAVPTTLIHSNGKAYTECQDRAEQQQTFQGRQVCVNSSGDYYFLADGTTVNTPVTLIHSNGKAYTECQDPAEQQQSLQGRQVCVNSSGDYYFLAD